MIDTHRTSFHIDSEEDLFHVRRMARKYAQNTGLAEAAEIRLATIVSELGRNMLKYAGRGTCEFTRHTPRGAAARVACVFRDHGPGIADMEAALSDGYSTGGTLGAGLPGVQRLADRFHIESDGQGTAVFVEVHAQRPADPGPPKGKAARALPIADTMRVGLATRAFPGERHCGDQSGAWQLGDMDLVCLVDGLGHGEAAEIAAKKVIRCVAENADRTLESILRRCDRALKEGRGAAVALLRAYRTKGQIQFLGVGNISCAFVSDRVRLLGSSYGVIGEGPPIGTADTLAVHPRDQIILWTDGLPESIGLVPHRLRAVPLARDLAQSLIAQHAGQQDDAGVAVYRVT